MEAVAFSNLNPSTQSPISSILILYTEKIYLYWETRKSVGIQMSFSQRGSTESKRIETVSRNDNEQNKTGKGAYRNDSTSKQTLSPSLNSTY